MILLGALLLAFFVLSPPWSYVAVGAAAAFEVVETWFLLRLSRRRQPAVGVETLVGARGVTTSACRPFGQVRVRGELWRAHCETGVDAGEEVEVVAVEVLTLTVERREDLVAESN